MKTKFTIVCTALLLYIGLSAQTSLLNGGFESWSTTSPSFPTNWDSYDDLYKMYGGVAASALHLCTKDSVNVYSGNAACKLRTDTVPNFGPNPGFLISNTMGFNVTVPVFHGWPFTDKPVALKGAQKYVPTGSDTATLTLTLTKWDAAHHTEILVGAITGFIGATAGNSYVTFNDTIQYQTDTVAPDTLTIFFQSSNIARLTNLGSTLWLDDLAFDYGTTGIVHFSMDDAVKVFPNPAFSALTISVDNYMVGDKLMIYDVSGRLITSSILQNATSEIELSNYANGVYLYQLNDQNNQLVYKNKFVVTR